MTTVAEARDALGLTLREAGVVEWREDARRLVAHALRVEPGRLAVERERRLTDRETEALVRYRTERLDGRTVARIVGSRPFHDIVLAVADDVLEPRDDTAALVELALPYLRAASDRNGAARLLDVGVGAGTVALALLAAEPRSRGWGTDVSPAARRLATANAVQQGLGDRFAIAEGALVGSGSERLYDLIVSNPPYITTADMAGLAPEARADPPEALDGGRDGLDFYRALAREARTPLAPGGTLAVEIGAGQGADVRALMMRCGWREVGAMRDLGAHERALAFQRDGADPHVIGE